jgi:hypothetical protein
VDFGGAENMRRAFIRLDGQPPQSMRRLIKVQFGRCPVAKL